MKVQIGPGPGIIDDGGAIGMLLRERKPLSVDMRADMHVAGLATNLAARPAR
jgi:hypothetical protein